MDIKDDVYRVNKNIELPRNELRKELFHSEDKELLNRYEEEYIKAIINIEKKLEDLSDN